jgi:hypothetical protein
MVYSGREALRAWRGMVKVLRLPLRLLVVGAAGAGVLAAGVVAGTYVSRSITSSDPGHTYGVFPDGVASSCPQKTFPGAINPASTYHYDLYNEANPLAGADCVTITLKVSTGSAFAVAYFKDATGGFTPSNLSSHYLGDVGNPIASGQTKSFKVSIAAGQSVDVDVEEAYPGQGVQSYDLTIAHGVPTAVATRSLAARRTGAGVALTWRTASETDILGFHLYREHGGARVRLDPRLIGALAPSKRYSFLDRRASRAGSARYWLQVVHLNGSRSWAGVIRVF